ncbi:MAG: lysogenization protein HflD [bacterium]
MPTIPDKNQTLALAGALQSSMLAHQLARHRRHDRDALHHSSFSLLRLQADSVEEIFHSIDGLRLGLDSLVRLLGGRFDSAAREAMQYAFGLHQISRRLQHNHPVQSVVGEMLGELSERFLQHFDNTDHDDELHFELAALYVAGISRLTPRLIVHGSQRNLEDARAIRRIRAALFAGIRAAWLWHQLGGRRWHLLRHRKAYAHQAKRLLGPRLVVPKTRVGESEP